MLVVAQVDVGKPGGGEAADGDVAGVEAHLPVAVAAEPGQVGVDDQRRGAERRLVRRQSDLVRSPEVDIERGFDADRAQVGPGLAGGPAPDELATEGNRHVDVDRAVAPPRRHLAGMLLQVVVDAGNERRQVTAQFWIQLRLVVPLRGAVVIPHPGLEVGPHPAIVLAGAERGRVLAETEQIVLEQLAQPIPRPWPSRRRRARPPRCRRRCGERPRCPGRRSLPRRLHRASRSPRRPRRTVQ